MQAMATMIAPGTKGRKAGDGAGWVRVELIGPPHAGKAGYVYAEYCHEKQPKAVSSAPSALSIVKTQVAG